MGFSRKRGMKMYKKYLILFILTLIIITASFSQDPDPLAEARYLANNPNRIENVPRILDLMNQVGVWDINEDGEVNCIDHSFLFRIMYGSNAKIIINVNPETGMNHMFIRIWYNGGQIMDIEPQGTSNRYAMGLVWGVLYDPIYNRDVTSQWTHVVPGMY
jgi:hypothetical protein